MSYYYTYNGKIISYIGNKKLTGPKVFDDWFLPVQTAVLLMCQNLRDMGFGGTWQSGPYWSSDENISTKGAYAMSSITNCGGTSGLKSEVLHVRPIRMFDKGNITYSHGDIGPSGGWIFYSNEAKYFEAHSEDLEDSIWSNVSDDIAGANNSAIGQGLENTNIIINQPGHISSAAKLCADLIVYKY